MRVKLTKLSSTHNNIRTEEVTGECQKLPEVGNNFVMTGPPVFGQASLRVIQTTPIKAVNKYGEYILSFETENSKYALEIL